MDNSELSAAQSASLFSAVDTSGMDRAFQRLQSHQKAINVETEKSIKLGEIFGSTFGSALEGLIFKGRSFGDTIRDIGLKLSRLAFQSAFKPIEQGFNSFLSSFVSNLASGGAGLTTPTVAPFAKGGVIASPVAFPLGGGVGLAGEAGPEAIMPLTRGPDGRLGVAANGGGGINVTFNVTATDAESFRRSETQIAALLVRAVANGQRNL